MTILFILLCLLGLYAAGVVILCIIGDYLNTDNGRLVGMTIFTIVGGIFLLFLNYAMYWNLFESTRESWFEMQINQLATLMVLVADVMVVYLIHGLWKDK